MSYHVDIGTIYENEIEAHSVLEYLEGDYEFLQEALGRCPNEDGWIEVMVDYSVEITLPGYETRTLDDTAQSSNGMMCEITFLKSLIISYPRTSAFGSVSRKRNQRSRLSRLRLPKLKRLASYAPPRLRKPNKKNRGWSNQPRFANFNCQHLTGVWI